MNQTSTELSVRPVLDYPFKRGFHPEPGVPYEVANDVYWLYMPMPMSLDHINLWLLKDHDEWVIVDSGLDAALCKETWEIVFKDFVSPHLVNKIIITHFHPDHIGLASWLAERCECKVWISEGEFRHYRKVIKPITEEQRAETKDFIKQIGYKESQQELYSGFFLPDEKPEKTRVQERVCKFIKAGDDIEINGISWQIILGNGHSPEHSCLYSSELEVLISGDQALPRISSNVSVYPNSRDMNPLYDWLESCERLRDKVPANTLVLPSHQEPFVGIDLRMQQLIDDHHAQLNSLRQNLHQEINTTQARAILFTRELGTIDTLLATGETLAHLNYLLHAGEIRKRLNHDQLALYCST